MSTSAPSEPLSALLHRVFGHREFRAHQREVCEAASAGRDVLLVMPTGAGKSLCYQLPALARRAANGGAALVVSPLIALMDDQANKLSALGLRVARIHSGVGREASREACRDYLANTLDFLFIAPERMRVPGFPEMLRKRELALVAIDEAHCISQWGHDFRPDYRMLGGRLPGLRPAPIVALTATATPAVQKDIVAQLQLQQPAVFITGFRRDNLAIESVELSKPQRAEYTAKLLADESARPAIVYASSRKSAEEIAARLNKDFAARVYHAGLEPSVRERVQNDFLSGKLDVVVATVAFGMGVDKADVRTVVHVALPASVEAYYQEIGRAGRDGKPSRTVLLHNFGDRKTLEFFLEKNYPATSDLTRVAAALREDFVMVDSLQRKLTMEHETLERSLEKLLGYGVAEVNMDGEVCAARDAAQSLWQSNYNAQVSARRNQMERMFAFAEGHTCRMVALVKHFGDTTDTVGACGKCDVCNPAGTGSGLNGANKVHAPDANERGYLRAILRAIEGRGQSTGKLFTDLKIVKDRKEFDGLLDALARAGLINIANETFRAEDGRDVTYRKAIITHEGRSPDDATLATVVIRGSDAGSSPNRKAKAAEPIARRALASNELPNHKMERNRERKQMQRAADDAMTPTAAALQDRLKVWRLECARGLGVRAFHVMADSLLRAIACEAPATSDELLRIPGMGPMRMEKHGAAILAICRGERI